MTLQVLGNNSTTVYEELVVPRRTFRAAAPAVEPEPSTQPAPRFDPAEEPKREKVNPAPVPGPGQRPCPCPDPSTCPMP